MKMGHDTSEWSFKIFLIDEDETWYHWMIIKNPLNWWRWDMIPGNDHLKSAFLMKNGHDTSEWSFKTRLIDEDGKWYQWMII